MTDRTDLLVVLDRSGSMATRQSDHEGGLRSFIRDQRNLAGEVRLTFVRFDHVDPFEVVYDRTPLDQVDEEKLTLVPRGGTPLLEAVIRSLAHLEERLAVEPLHAVVGMIITDGQENQSAPEYTRAVVQARVKAWQDAGRVLLYLGANVDEFDEAQRLGVGAVGASGYAPTPSGVHAMYANISHNTRSYRESVTAGGEIGVKNQTMAFTDDQRALAKDATSVSTTDTTDVVNVNPTQTTTGGAA